MPKGSKRGEKSHRGGRSAGGHKATSGPAAQRLQAVRASGVTTAGRSGWVPAQFSFLCVPAAVGEPQAPEMKAHCSVYTARVGRFKSLLNTQWHFAHPRQETGLRTLYPFSNRLPFAIAWQQIALWAGFQCPDPKRAGTPWPSPCSCPACQQPPAAGPAPLQSQAPR